MQKDADGSCGSAPPAEADVTGLTLSESSSAQPANGHAECGVAAAASPAAAGAPSAAGTDAETSAAAPSSAAAAAPLTQDALIEVCACTHTPVMQLPQVLLACSCKPVTCWHFIMSRAVMDQARPCLSFCMLDCRHGQM